MTFSTEKSRQMYERTLGVLIEASSSSSRGPATFGKYPIFMEGGRGSRIYDADGNEYIDWMMGFGALPLGHAHPEVVEAITEAAATGAHFARQRRWSSKLLRSSKKSFLTLSESVSQIQVRKP